MTDPLEIEDARRRLLYQYVERNGAVTPETARKNVLVRPKTASKPARSGPELEPSVPMSPAEFDRHVDALEDDGYLTVADGKLRVAVSPDEDAETVALEDGSATVRPARQEDIDGLVDVIETVAGEAAYVVAARLAAEVAREDVLLRQNEREDRVFFVATLNGDGDETGGENEGNGERDGEGGIVGWLHVGGGNAPNMGHTAKLTLGVLDARRGHGLGSALMDRGLAWADDRGYRKIYQALPATNEAARAFLESQGWTVESTREGHYRIDDELVDEVQLAVWLDD